MSHKLLNRRGKLTLYHYISMAIGFSLVVTALIWFPTGKSLFQSGLSVFRGKQRAPVADADGKLIASVMAAVAESVPPDQIELKVGLPPTLNTLQETHRMRLRFAKMALDGSYRSGL
jgi:hypothetical protein